MASTAQEAEQIKVVRAMIRLKHSLAADREIVEVLAQRVKIGTDGAVPQIAMSLDELLGSANEG